jgi:hypothetical protein
MSDRTFERKKAATSSFSHPSLVSPHTPTLANPDRGFGLPTNNIVQAQTVESANQQAAQAADEKSKLLQALEQPSFGHDISRISFRPQTKLTVGEPGDKYEQEADWMANQVMRMVVPNKLNAPTVQPVQDSLLSQANQQRSFGHDISRIALHRPQAKLTVGEPGDKYEQEADRVADQVMSMPESAPVQREMAPEEEEVQTKPLAASITPLVQREAIPEEEEVQTKPLANTLQREAMPEEEEEEPVQTKPLGNGVLQREAMPEEEEVQTKPLAMGTLQREAMPEEEEVQTKPLADTLQREDMPEEEEIRTKLLANTVQRQEMPEEEEAVQTKPSLQRATDGSLQAGGNLESRLNSSQGGGSPLPQDVKGFMESRFRTDFSQVRVHTDSEAVQMNRDLNAQAFTHKQDVYFGAGKAPGKDELTAHELTHVVQQSGNPQTSIQREDSGTKNANLTGGITPKAVTALTHTELLSEWKMTKDWLAKHKSDDTNYAATAEYHDQLQSERYQRIQKGQIWLAEGENASTGALYSIIPQGNITLITQSNAGASADSQGNMVVASQAQFAKILSRLNFTTIDYAIYANGIAAAENKVQKTEGLNPSTSAALPTGNTLPSIASGWYPFARNPTPSERAAMQTGQILHYTDANNLSSIVQPDGSISLNASTGYRNLANPGFNRSSYFFNGQPTSKQATANLAGRGSLAEMGVIALQGADLPPNTMYRPIDGVVVVPGGYKGSGTAVPPGGALPAPRSPAPSPPVTGSPPNFRAAVGGEGGFSGHPMGAASSSAVVAILMEGGIMLVKTGELPSGQEMANTGTTAAFGGAIGAVTENVAARGIASVAGGAMAGRFFITLGRGVAGGAGGAIAAPVVEMGKMALDDKEHTGTDYAARGTRASVSGAVGGFVGAATTGALAGSVAPGIGTAIGFIVGAVGYMVADALIGDALEAGVKSATK